MKQELVVGLILLLTFLIIIPLVTSYTPQMKENVTLVFDSDYVIPSRDNVTLILNFNETNGTINKELIITDPTTSSPKSVSGGDHISINFNYQIDGANQTADVSIENVLIGGNESSIIGGGSGSPTNVFETFESAPENWTFGYVTTASCEPVIDDDGTPSLNTGPCNGNSNCPTDDAGVDDNWYVYTEMTASACPSGSYGTITSDFEIDFDSLSNGNVSFWYHRLGSSIGSKQSLEENSSGSWVEIWYINTSDSSDTWYQSSYNLSTLSGKGNLRFTIYGNGQYSNDMAYDAFNVTYSSGGQQFAYLTGVGWQVNVTVPSFLTGLKDLFVNATYSGDTLNDTQSNAINYNGGASECSPTNDEDWIITDTQTCTSQTPNTGTGKTIINTGGSLYLYSSTLTTSGLEINENGDVIFIDDLSQIII